MAEQAIMPHVHIGVAPPKAWRNWWRAIKDVEITHPGGILDLAVGAEFHDARSWPSKEVAEQRAVEQPAEGVVEWLGAYPEGERPKQARDGEDS